MLGTEDAEVRVRALMGLGMLLPSSPENQQTLASDTTAMKTLLVSACCGHVRMPRNMAVAAGAATAVAHGMHADCW